MVMQWMAMVLHNLFLLFQGHNAMGQIIMSHECFGGRL